MRRCLRSIWCIVAAVGVVPAACAQEVAPVELTRQAAQAARVGDYDVAVDRARRALAASPASASAARVLVEVLLATGRAPQALEAGTAWEHANPGSAALATILGATLARLGLRARAESTYVRAIAGHAADSLTAAVRLAQLRFERGDVDGATREFDRFIDIYNNRRSRLTPSELMAIGVACRYLGRTDPQLFKDALKAFDLSIAADSLAISPRVQLADLFLSKYNGADARISLDEVLAVNPRNAAALLGMARLRQFDFHADAAEWVKKSLDVDPSNPEARAFSSLLLTDLERYEEAIAEARRGLMDDSLAYDPLVALAAAQYLKGDTTAHRQTLERALVQRPRSADAEGTLADVMARNRMYGEAVSFARRAVQRDDRASRALAFLGVNALRIGQVEEGRTMLERAFAIDPYDVWSKNTLDLLDTYKDYEVVKTARFTFLVEKRDAALLALYAGPLAEEAFDSLVKRYGYRPAGQVRVEIYRSHADFSVRTVGLAGLGALGVSFGDVVAIDGPAARAPGEFNWGSTLWHEITHTFTLGATGNRVPRWFSEGLSVYEERRARPGWGQDITPAFAAAFKGGQLVTLARMNDGFMRPKFPEQVLLSYYQASLVCELIERDFGTNAIRLLLLAYQRGLTTEVAVVSVLKTDLNALQQRFDAFVNERFARELAAVKPEKAPEGEHATIGWGGPFQEAMKTAEALAEAKQLDAAERELEKAKRLFPSYVGEDSPYAILARIALARNDTVRAVAELTALASINEDAWAANRQLAALAEARGDAPAAVSALSRAMYIFPHDLESHVQLARVAQRAGNHVVEVRERRAVLALDPVDRVEALYQLARALFDAGDRESARREVLHALEVAPNYDKALELLLKIREPGAGNPRVESGEWRTENG